MKKSNSVLCIILAVAMIISLLPLSVWAENNIPSYVSYISEGKEIYFDGEIIPFSAESIKLYYSASQSGVAELYYFVFDKAVKLPCKTEISGNCVNVIPTERIEEGARHKIVFGNSEVYFTATKSKNDILYFYDDFEGESTKMNLYHKEAVITQETVNGNKMLCFSMPEGVVGEGYADAVAPLAENEDSVVVDVYINPIKIEGRSFIGLFDSKNSQNAWKLGATMYPDGSIKMNVENKSTEETVGTWQAGNPFRYTAIYDNEGGECHVYIDKVLKKTVKVNTLKTKTFRIDISNKNGGDAKIYIDNLKIYGGEEIFDNANFGTGNRYSVTDHSMTAKSALGDALMFTEGEYYFKDGEKQRYQKDSLKPEIIDGKMYVSESFVKEILGIDSAAFEKTDISGKMMIPAEAVASNMGMEYLFDKRGFFILSEEKFPYVDSHNFTTLFETSDYIYRHINFANPKSEEVLQDLRDNIGEGVHPRLYYTKEDIEYIKNKAKTDAKWTILINKTISNADTYLSKEITLSSDCADSEKQSQASSFQSIMEYLSAAYLLTGNEEYAKKGMEYMDILCGWKSMGYTTSNLTTGHWAMGMAVGYDAFYNFMMSCNEGMEKAEYYRERVRELPFRDTIDAYLGRAGREKVGEAYKNVHWITIRDNFQGVISGGIIALALSMADEEDMYEDSMHILENVIRSMELAVSLYAPDGGYFEGVGYSEYMLGNLTKGITALFNSCGTDYGFGLGKGFADAGEFFVHMQTPENRLNFSDCSRSASKTMIPAFFAHYYGKTYYAKLMVEENKLRGENYDMLGWLHYYKAMERYGDVDTSNTETDRYYYAAESGVFRSSFDTKTPTFAGFHAGTTKRAHDMLDSGEFVFEAGGVPWAIDLGGDNYDLPSYFGDAGYKIYRKHTQGENCVIINPLTDADNYYGQAFNKEAVLEKFVSKPKGAFATVNLTDVYERDVNSYKRGYYFGDMRNTLTVQDEINLKDTSEMYWFMHTVADIEIIDNSVAKLSYDGEELLLYVYSDKPYTLSEMEAKPLEGTPVIEGQNANADVKKVALHFENVSGDINISVKLVHISKYFTYDEHTFIPMDNWSVADGECEITPVITDVYVDPFKKMSIVVQIPAQAKEAYILADGKIIYGIEEGFGKICKITDIDVSQIGYGKHHLALKIIYGDGSEKIGNGEFFVVNKFSRNIFYSNNMAENVTATTMPSGWYFRHAGAAVQNDDSITVTKGSSSYAAYEFRATNALRAISDEVIVMECDVRFSSLSSIFNIECKSAEKGWFFNTYTLFANGIMYGGAKYNTNTWYRIKLMINTKSNLCSFYVDNKLIIDNAYIENATSNYVYKLQFVPDKESDSVSYKNFEVYTYASVPENITISLDKEEENIKAEINVLDGKQETRKNLVFVVCEYSENGLLNIYSYDVTLSDVSFKREEFIKISDSAVEFKAFLFDKDEKLTAIIPSVLCEIN